MFWPQDGLRWLENTYRDRARGWVGFNVPFSHRLTAAADILLMPSRFEPCGLNQVGGLGCCWLVLCVVVGHFMPCDKTHVALLLVVGG